MLFTIQTQVLTLLLVLILAIIYIVYFNIELAKQSPLAKPTGIVLITELMVTFFDQWIKDNLSKNWVKNFAPYIAALSFIVLIGSTIAVIGIPAATTSYTVTFTLSVVTFAMIHFTALKQNGWGYFKRFTKPFIVFLPINLIAVWAPLISLSLRLFANMLAGAIIISMIYQFTGLLMKLTFIPINLLGIMIGPVFHGYFDLFTGTIQAVVFVSLTVIYISQEFTNTN